MSKDIGDLNYLKDFYLKNTPRDSEIYAKIIKLAKNLLDHGILPYSEYFNLIKAISINDKTPLVQKKPKKVITASLEKRILQEKERKEKERKEKREKERRERREKERREEEEDEEEEEEEKSVSDDRTQDNIKFGEDLESSLKNILGKTYTMSKKRSSMDKGMDKGTKKETKKEVKKEVTKKTQNSSPKPPLSKTLKKSIEKEVKKETKKEGEKKTQNSSPKPPLSNTLKKSIEKGAKKGAKEEVTKKEITKKEIEKEGDIKKIPVEKKKTVKPGPKPPLVKKVTKKVISPYHNMALVKAVPDVIVMSDINVYDYYNNMKNLYYIVDKLVDSLNEVGKHIGISISKKNYGVGRDMKGSDQVILETLMKYYDIWNNNTTILKILYSTLTRDYSYYTNNIPPKFIRDEYDIEILNTLHFYSGDIYEFIRMDDYIEKTIEEVPAQNNPEEYKDISARYEEIEDEIEDEMEDEIYNKTRHLSNSSISRRDMKYLREIKEIIDLIEPEKERVFKYGIFNIGSYNVVKNKPNVSDLIYFMRLRMWYYFTIFLEKIPKKDRDQMVLFIKRMFWYVPDMQKFYLYSLGPEIAQRFHDFTKSTEGLAPQEYD